jgi:hypothetical protein
MGENRISIWLFVQEVTAPTLPACPELPPVAPGCVAGGSELEQAMKTAANHVT